MTKASKGKKTDREYWPLGGPSPMAPLHSIQLPAPRMFPRPGQNHAKHSPRSMAGNKSQHAGSFGRPTVDRRDILLPQNRM